MDLTQWLEAEEGRAAELAAHFKLTRSAVSQWKTNGVPLARMKQVRDFTHGAVSLDEMVPDRRALAEIGQTEADAITRSACARREEPSSEREGQ